MNAKGGEDVLMLVELSECLFYQAKGCGGMNGVLCHVEEVKDGTDGLLEWDVGNTIGKSDVKNQSKKNLAHLCMLLS
jgi:hypothetical protein